MDDATTAEALRQAFREADGLEPLVLPDAEVIGVGLDSLFDGYLSSYRASWRAFLTVAHELGVDASDCLFVGDSAAHDIAGARSAGMRGLLVNHSVEEAVGIKTAVLACITAHGDAR
ncbi:HAD hydrolase-like protein [Curtobacterium sp. MCPF17_021]|uniref:HAD family hydrolase n=1 Tax=Curtobacterium sp. MCPF17_021 TaxID=2175639 RepID=UPI000DA9BF2F|nr:HAD hydrolase-like protein [Curtobacterium sp. MCPF17_021]WIE82682.1 HAD hydrolase-like protein [Curtobacterium sp. MCPF17_021]